MLAQSLQCPECGSTRIWKDGLRYINFGEVQRYVCRDCGYRFSDPDFSRKITNSSNDKQGSRQICVSESEMKNLVTVENHQKQDAGATTLDKATIKGKLVEFSWYMQKEGYKNSTIRARLDCIKCLISKGAGSHLLEPEKIKGIIAKQTKWGNGYKSNIVITYTTFLNMHGKTWKPPKYRKQEKIPWIPMERELDQLIMSTSKRMSIFLQILKETGADPGEANAIEWIDINTEAQTITINHPVKGHRPRILEVSRNLIDRLNTLPKNSNRVFQGIVTSYQKNFSNQRKRIANKLNNPRLLKIKFTTFRHWKATMEYHKTRDILWVMKLLGHHSLKTTLIYIDLEKATYRTSNDDFTVKVAEDLNEACKLLEVGFEYVTDMNGKKLFRKRK